MTERTELELQATRLEELLKRGDTDGLQELVEKVHPSDLADILARWQKRKAEKKRARTDQSFLVPKSEIANNDYDLSINRYKEVEYDAVEYDPPKVILERLAELEEEIARGREELEGMLG